MSDIVTVFQEFSGGFAVFEALFSGTILYLKPPHIPFLVENNRSSSEIISFSPESGLLEFFSMEIQPISVLLSNFAENVDFKLLNFVFSNFLENHKISNSQEKSDDFPVYFSWILVNIWNYIMFLYEKFGWFLSILSKEIINQLWSWKKTNFFMHQLLKPPSTSAENTL